MRIIKYLILLLFIASTALAIDIKVPQLPAALSVVPTDLVMIDHANASKKATARQVAIGGLGFAADAGTTPTTIPVRNSTGKLPGNITGDADTLDGSHASAFATASQGIKADTADAFRLRSQGFATAAQGALADTALQDPTQFIIPPGMVAPFVGVSCPRGWVAGNGSAMTDAISAPLYLLTGDTLPDLRGEFIRGWSNGRSLVDAGRGVGTAQDESVKAHTHTIDFANHSAESPDGSGFPTSGSTSTGGGTITNFDTLSYGGTETRPRNVALLYCIKK